MASYEKVLLQQLDFAVATELSPSELSFSDEINDYEWENDIIWNAEDGREKLASTAYEQRSMVDTLCQIGLDENFGFLPKDLPPVPRAGKNGWSNNNNMVMMAGKYLKKLQQGDDKLSQQRGRPPQRPPPPPPLPVVKFSQDPFNISNDEYYCSRSTGAAAGELSSTSNLLRKRNGENLCHAPPVIQLQSPYVPIHLWAEGQLINFHRPSPSLRNYAKGRLATRAGPHTVTICPSSQQNQNGAEKVNGASVSASAGEVNKSAASAKEKPVQSMSPASTAGAVKDLSSLSKITKMKIPECPESLSGKDGRLVLIEYSEEHPPLLNLVGMCSIIRNYFKRHAEKNVAPPTLQLGETVFTHSSPFLGAFRPGELLQAIENNMFRAPIFEHLQSGEDFVLIRARKELCVREFDHIFTGAQLCPLVEVPAPGSREVDIFIRSFVQVFIYRLFSKSSSNPPKIHTDELRILFTIFKESFVLGRLKLCAEFKRAAGANKNCWVLKPEFELPTEEALVDLVTPEQVAAYCSLLEADEWLKVGGFASIVADEDNLAQLRQENKVAPWNTTSAYISAVKGKCNLQLVGPGDPTGVGEGFSYIPAPVRPEIQDGAPLKRAIMGTDADLRKLSANSAKSILRKLGVHEKILKKPLKRWELINMVRSLSTEKTKKGCRPEVSRFFRHRIAVSGYQQRYREECQRIFELQNQVLKSSEVLSSDEDDEDEDDDDVEKNPKISDGGAAHDDEVDSVERLGKSLEELVTNQNKTAEQFTYQQEEKQRLQLRQQMLLEKEKSAPVAVVVAKTEPEILGRSSSSSVLFITRKTQQKNGQVWTSREIVRDPALIQIYVKIRTLKNESFIRGLVQEELKAEAEAERRKRRLAIEEKREQKEQLGLGLGLGVNKGTTLTLKRLGNNNLKIFGRKKKQQRRRLNGRGGYDDDDDEEHNPRWRRRGGVATTLGGKRYFVRCSNCGLKGHMKTSKICSMYQKEGGAVGVGGGGNGGLEAQAPPVTPVCVRKVRNSSGVSSTEAAMDEKPAITVDGTKIHLSRKLVQLPQDCPDPESDESSPQSLSGDDEEEEEEEHTPTAITTGQVPVAVANNNKRRRNSSGNNSAAAAGAGAGASATAHCDYLTYTGKTVNRRRIDPRVLMYNVFEEALQEMRSDDASFLFLKPVTKKVINYYNVIKSPMCLLTIQDKIKQSSYDTSEEFLKDVELIVQNSVTYNGECVITENARKLLEISKKKFAQNSYRLKEYEKMINPLLDDDLRVKINYILKQVLDKAKTLAEAIPFLRPVNRKTVKGYYEVIKMPMDIDTMEAKMRDGIYSSRYDFLYDVDLIQMNAIQFNGSESGLASQANIFVQFIKKVLSSCDGPLTELEISIQREENPGQVLVAAVAAGSSAAGAAASTSSTTTTDKDHSSVSDMNCVVDGGAGTGAGGEEDNGREQ